METAVRFQVSNEDRKVARRVAAARAIAELSQDQLARKMTRITGDQWTKTMVGRMEQGRKFIPAGLLYSLSPRRSGRSRSGSYLIRVIEKSRWRREPPGGHPPPIDPPPDHR